MKIKVIAFDAYGTIISSGDTENAMPPRRGFLEFAEQCRKKGIILVTSSDCDIILLKLDLEASRFPLEIFHDFYKMEPGVPKDFSEIISEYNIEPGELLVFGDKPDIDIALAKKMGCRVQLVSEYDGPGNKFDFMDIRL